MTLQNGSNEYLIAEDTGQPEIMRNVASVGVQDKVAIAEGNNALSAISDQPILSEGLKSAFIKIEAQLSEWDNPKSPMIRNELNWLRKSPVCNLLQEKISGEVVTLMYLSEEDEAIEMEWRGRNNIFCVTVDLIRKEAQWHNSDLSNQKASHGNLPPIDTPEGINKIRSLVHETF